jgi:F-type H+-transporting ATPase subunit a
MMGDHMVFNIMSGLIPWPVAYPVIFLGLGLLVCVIQAFVFALLTSVYISLAVPHGDHHGDSH